MHEQEGRRRQELSTIRLNDRRLTGLEGSLLRTMAGVAAAGGGDATTGEEREEEDDLPRAIAPPTRPPNPMAIAAPATKTICH